MPVIGLDLGNNHFRAAELNTEKGRTILKRFGSYDKSDLNLFSDDANDLKLYSDNLRHFITETGFNTTNVIVSLPEAEVFTSVISVPAMETKDLSSSIRFEAEQYIPLPMDQVKFDFQILDKDINDQNKMEILLVAAKNQVLTKYVNVVKKAGLTVVGIEPETLAIQRVLASNPNNPNASIIVNITSTSTLVIISYRGAVRFTRSIGIGGIEFTKAVQQSLNLDYSQAEEYKKTYGLDSAQVEGKVYNAIKPVFDRILAEINRSKIFYTSRYPSVNMDKVIISGGTALMPGLLYYIANNFDLEVELANPWRNIQLSSSIEDKKEYLLNKGPVFVTPVGLALKEIK